MTEDSLTYALHPPTYCAGCRAQRREQAVGKAGAEVPSGEDTLPGAVSQTGAFQGKALHSSDPLRPGGRGRVGAGAEGLGEGQMLGPGAWGQPAVFLP